jgi:hypothetical protein
MTPTGGSPELDTIMVIVMAWILAPIDVSLTWIRGIKKRRKQELKTIKTVGW